MAERLGNLVQEQGAVLEALHRFVPMVREAAVHALTAAQSLLQQLSRDLRERRRVVEREHQHEQEHVQRPSRGFGPGM